MEGVLQGIGWPKKPQRQVNKSKIWLMELQQTKRQCAQMKYLYPIQVTNRKYVTNPKQPNSQKKKKTTHLIWLLKKMD